MRCVSDPTTGLICFGKVLDFRHGNIIIINIVLNLIILVIMIMKRAAVKQGMVTQEPKHQLVMVLQSRK